MSQPKFVNKKYDPAKAPPPYPRVHPKTLLASPSKRILDLALPKRRVLLDAMRFAKDNRAMTASISNLLWRIRRSRYQRYRVLCNALQQRTAARERRLRAKLRKALKPEDWQRHRQFLARIAAPKVARTPKSPVKRRKWRPVNMKRLRALAQPPSKETPEIRDPFKVAPSALTYKISKRVREIAFRKKPLEIIPPRIPGVVSPAAMKAVATSRTIILAKPAVRPAGVETDLRQDAFTVSPAALKARCSKRIKHLAMPKTYGK